MKGLCKHLLGGLVLSGLCLMLLAVPAQAKAKHTVTFMYGTKVNTQVVPHGGNAIVPIDTGVEGFTFLGWTDTCMNVTTDKLILGMYKKNDVKYVGVAENCYDTGLKKINNNTSAPFLPWWDGTKGVPGVTCVLRWYNGHNNELWKTEVVPYGTSLPDPPDPCVAGYEFIGWEGSWKNITEDRAIKAWYFRTHEVRFYSSIDGSLLDVQHIRDNEAARKCEPFFEGYEFKEYSRDVSHVTEDMEVTCIYQ